MSPPPRSPRQRKRDVLDRLEHDVDAWVATAGEGSGTPYLVPLSFLWDGVSLFLATPSSSTTSRNLQATGRVRLGIGATRDVVLVQGTVVVVVDVTAKVGDAFAAKAGFDPRELDSYTWFLVQPQRIQAWREADELEGRELMRGGRWLVP